MTQAPNSPTVWTYVARARDRSTQRGVITGQSGAEVRAQLRKRGLDPIRLKAKRQATAQQAILRSPIESWLRSRRQASRARLFESLATLLESGLSLHEALRTIAASKRKRSRSASELLTRLLASVESGNPLSEALAEHPAWFGTFELAMAEAGETRGELAAVLRRLADRERQAGELSAKLIAALAYPLLVAAIGLVVVVVLATRALPELVGVLESSGIETPRLTQFVMAIGELLASRGIPIAAALAILLAIAALAFAWARTRRLTLPTPIVIRLPEVARKLRTAAVVLELSELVRCGVTLPAALRVVSGTQRGLVAGSLAIELNRAADHIDEGQPLSNTLADSAWFDPEHARLIEIGETSGELSDILQRLGTAEFRAAQRAVDRFTSFLQPAAILALAVLIGFIVMSAIQPIVKLREILG